MKWTYKALDAGGKVVEGEWEGESRFTLLEKVRADGMTMLAVSEVEGQVVAEKEGFHLPWGGVKAQSVTTFLRQLAEITHAGIPLTEGLRSLQIHEASPRLAQVIASVYKEVLQGKSFSDALAQHPRVFGKIAVSMIRVGETSGHLPDVLSGLADFGERDAEIRGKIRSALAYPLFTLAFSVILCYVLVSFVLPGFEPIWTQSGLNMHKYPITEFLLWLSHITHDIWDEIAVVAALALIFGLYISLMRSSRGQAHRDLFVITMPVLGHFIEMGVLARMNNTISILFSSGINAVRAMDLASETAGNVVYEQALKDVANNLRQGVGLAEAFRMTDRFPPMMLQMLGVAEQGGSVDTMMPRMADYYDRQLESSLRMVASMMEPITMIAVGGLVSVFIMGVFLPIMGIVTSLESQM